MIFHRIRKQRPWRSTTFFIGLVAVGIPLGWNGYVIWRLWQGRAEGAHLLSWWTAWVGVLAVFWLVGLGLVAWLTVSETEVSLVFLWAMSLIALTTLAGAAAPVLPHAHRLGSPALVLLAAAIVHFHLLFPQEVESTWRYPVLVGVYTLAGVQALAWLIQPDLPGLRAVSQAFFVLAVIASWAWVVSVARWWGTSPEEKWVARWVAIVFFVGGVVPTLGIPAAERLQGHPLLPLAFAYGLEMVIPLGYLAVMRQYAPWQEQTQPAPHILVTFAALVIEVMALGNGTVILVTAFSHPVLRRVVPVIALLLAYPLFRGLRGRLEQELYGGWYQRDTFLRAFGRTLGRVRTQEEVWQRAVQALAEGMKMAWVCGADDTGHCYCWGSAVVDEDECPETPAWETTVRSGANVLGRLMFGRHIEGSGLSRKDRWALEIAARLLGMQLEVHRLRDALAAQEKERGPSPLRERERDILRLVAQGKLDREIADELHLSRKTVESHLQHIYRKLGVRNRAAAVAIAVGEGWIEPPEWYRDTKGNP